MTRRCTFVTLLFPALGSLVVFSSAHDFAMTRQRIPERNSASHSYWPAQRRTCPAAQLIDGDQHHVAVNSSYFIRFIRCQDKAGKSQMDEKTYLVSFKEPGLAPVLVEAGRVEVHGEHLVFLRSSGELSALFLSEIVRDWWEIDP